MKDASLCVREKKMEKLRETAAWEKKNEMILQSLKNNDG